MANLFRNEVIENKKSQILGNVILTQPQNFTTITFYLTLITALIVLFLSFASLNRKEVVKGYLTPNLGLKKVYPHRGGIVDNIFISEGDFVEQGQKLFSIKSENIMSTQGSENLILELEKQIKDATKQKVILKNLNDLKKKELEESIKYLKKSFITLDTQINALKKRLKINKERRKKFLRLHEKNNISEELFNEQEEAYLSIIGDIAVNESHREKQLELLNLKNIALESLPIEFEKQLLNINKMISELTLRKEDISEKTSLDVLSPSAGKVTSIQVSSGEMVFSHIPSLSLIPKDSHLEAELLIPTRSYGFINKNQITRIRYEAFPYQRFGVAKGIISEVSKSVILPGELLVPIEIKEPVYKVKVKLEDQAVSLYGRKSELQAGMLLEADIILERRTLLEWLLEPIFSITGKF
ncbi:HlyD family efflux transporter periplasmic adaptor subunit [Pseudoalteromonas piratica]|uniref:AprE-like beta-barrel domain-containing protein n=1 Tax=Pseudoalteromonas piratica TaxID=1348114 RepID=A0A0A7ED37_9GAMM|nr:HlyD family efflux transporter periplasmic adaptor subunit [Pseudoalteromonas piratica]AIY63947.1 hypothetical protein OM33_01340 [Pseudoalteromonas piratica]